MQRLARIAIILLAFAGAMLAGAAVKDAAILAGAAVNDAGIEKGELQLKEHAFTVQQWKTDGSHLATVKGRLLYGGKPVAGAVLQAGPNGRHLETAEDGSFEFLLDKSRIAEKQVKVVSLDKARIGGKPLSGKAAKELAQLTATYQVYFPIEVTRVDDALTKPGHKAVHARLIFPAGDIFSFFRVDKYLVSGKVTDADGNPVKDAVVWLDRDNGEGFGKSTPTDENGAYRMFFLPEDEATNLTVVVGRERYTLPEGKFLKIPRGTSVAINIRLPREGRIISTDPPNLIVKTMDGALYTGIMPGLEVPPGVEYTITIPDREGRFVVTVPQEVWEKRPAFFETYLTTFIERKEVLKEGDPLPSGMIRPGAEDPRHIRAKIAA